MGVTIRNALQSFVFRCSAIKDFGKAALQAARGELAAYLTCWSRRTQIQGAFTARQELFYACDKWCGGQRPFKRVLILHEVLADRSLRRNDSDNRFQDVLELLGSRHAAI